jgi:hypothetical protein
MQGSYSLKEIEQDICLKIEGDKKEVKTKEAEQGEDWIEPILIEVEK